MTHRNINKNIYVYIYTNKHTHRANKINSLPCIPFSIAACCTAAATPIPCCAPAPAPAPAPPRPPPESACKGLSKPAMAPNTVFVGGGGGWMGVKRATEMYK